MESKRKLISGLVTTTLLALFILLTGCSMDASQTVQNGVTLEESVEANVSGDESRASTGRYELFVNGKRILSATYSRANAIKHCQDYQVKHGKKSTVLGKFNRKVIGYELFWNGKRVGYVPQWNKAQAIKNADWNQKNHGKSKTVLGKYEGRSIGYELFWDDKRVGYSPAWSRSQALNNYNWNKKRYPQKYVMARFDGYLLGDYWWKSVTERKAWPSYRENCWSNEAQGITNDGTYWYVASKYGIKKYHKYTNLSSNSFIWDIDRPHGSRHFGDITYFGGELFVPVEGAPGPQYGGDDRIYVYDRNGKMRRWGMLVQQDKAAWVAVNPKDGLMYTSASSYELYAYTRTFKNGEQLKRKKTIKLVKNGKPLKLHHVQGGVFSSKGHLYLSHHKKHSDDAAAGIYAFRVVGNTAYFVRYIRVKEDRKAHEEVEGLTIWDVDGKGIPGISGGQIHCVVLDNDAGQDDVTLRHYSVDWKGGL